MKPSICFDPLLIINGVQTKKRCDLARKNYITQNEDSKSRNISKHGNVIMSIDINDYYIVTNNSSNVGIAIL